MWLELLLIGQIIAYVAFVLFPLLFPPLSLQLHFPFSHLHYMCKSSMVSMLAHVRLFTYNCTAMPFSSEALTPKRRSSQFGT